MMLSVDVRAFDDGGLIGFRLAAIAIVHDFKRDRVRQAAAIAIGRAAVCGAIGRTDANAVAFFQVFASDGLFQHGGILHGQRKECNKK